MQVVRKNLLFGFGQFAQLVKFLGGIERIVGKPVFNQRVSIFFIQWFAFALAVWAQIASKTYAFVGHQTAPFQRFNNIFFSAGYKPVLIGIFDSKKKVAAMFFCE